MTSGFRPAHLAALKITLAAAVILMLLASLRGIHVGAEDDLRETHAALARLERLDDVDRIAAEAAWQDVINEGRPPSPAFRGAESALEIDSLAAAVSGRLAIDGLQTSIARLRELSQSIATKEGQALSLARADRPAAETLLNGQDYRSLRREWSAIVSVLRQTVKARRDADVVAIDTQLNRVFSLSLFLAALLLGVGMYAEYFWRRSRLAEAREAGVARIQQSILAAVGEGVLGLDASGKTVFANPAAQKVLGYTERDMLGKHQHMLIHYQHRDGTPYPVEECPIYKSLTDASTYVSENECFWTKGGECIAVDLVSTPIVENGTVTGVVQVFRDVTEKRRIERALKESEEAHRELFNRMPIGLYRTTPQGKVLQGNPALLKILGFDNLEALQAVQTSDLYINPEERTAWTDAVSTGTVDAFDAQVRRQDGETIWIRSSVRAIKGVDGLTLYFDGAIQDITDHKKTEIALQENLTTTHAILEAATDAFIAIDADGHILRWNAAATRTFGWTAEEIFGQTLNETIIPLQHRAAHARGMERVSEPGFAGTVNRRLEMTALHRDGREFPVEFTITAIPGKSLIFTSFLRDITERIKLAEHTRQNQKLEAMGGLAGGIAHDFNNLLTIILVSAEWLGEATPAEAREDLQQIIDATKKAQGLTQQLLAYSRKQFLHPSPTNLNGIVGSMDKLLRRVMPPDVEIVTMLEPSLGLASVDRGQIDQVLTNLVINARDALPQGGRILVETKLVEVMVDDRVYDTVPPGNYVMLSVSDNGVGMTPEVQSQAFEPFFTTKEVGKGTGLGLAMVHGIVKQTGGEILLNSATGLGTTVRILFPQLESSIKEGAALANMETPTGTERILVVEDQVAVRQAARRVLDSLGYIVYECSNGEEALKRTEDLGGNLDLVLTDLVMPEMGGRELARRLKQEFPQIKVLFMSGYSSETASGSTLETNTVGLLEKPFSRHTIAVGVREAIDAAQ